MNATTRIELAAAAALAAMALVTVPSAQAAPTCTAPNGQLVVHVSSGYDVTVDTNGPSVGPAAVIRTQDGTFDQSVLEGGIKGDAISFNVGTGGRGYVHFEGMVGDDGIARGTSSGIAQPIDLPAGTWTSVEPLECA